MVLVTSSWMGTQKGGRNPLSLSHKCSGLGCGNDTTRRPTARKVNEFGSLMLDPKLAFTELLRLYRVLGLGPVHFENLLLCAHSSEECWK